jgi:TrmH family RNA methyltransferase
MEVITSLDNKRIKNTGKLLNKKYRDEENKFLIEGEHLVEEAYKAGILLEVYQCEDMDRTFDVPTTYVTYDVIKKLSNTISPQKIIGVCKKIEEKELGNKVLILDDIQDPGNLGTIIRSAVAFKFDTVVLSSNTVDLYNPKVVRSTKGMLFNMNIIVRDLLTFLPELDGYTIYGTDVTNGINIKEEKIPEKCAIIIGNEGNGISNEVREYCEKFLYIGMEEGCESLNAGVSASILMYEVYNK